ncbi:MAG TPA: hypothetical protein VKC58_06125 [Myxococcales bacterium]|nr:hypothetical protein [Myxococcales bacterium]
MDLARSLAADRFLAPACMEKKRRGKSHLTLVARILAGRASRLAWAMARDLLKEHRVNDQKLIGVHHLRSEGRRIPVLLFRNGPSSVAGRCLIHPGDTPIVDGPSPEAVLALLAGVIDDLLLARGASAAPSV